MKLLLSFLSLCLSILPAAAAAPEFRGVWVATVANIDWPSRPGLTAVAQQRELTTLLDKCQKLNLNVVILQVRPMCDALYVSKLEPWSSFLTGTQGKHPGYDPLALAVEEAHQRKLELHVWLNPYRAWSPTAKGEPAANHLVKSRPDLAKKYGKHHWLNPTHPEVKAHSLAVAIDVVTRYDVDGVHMDDYFYPYPELDSDKKEIPFPDDDTWDAYQKGGGKLARDDWRRDAVNGFVKELYEGVHKAKPHVKVGISPFGIWRPGYPEGIAGFDQYGKLYADAKLWLNEGWVDYWTPQLYWPIAQEKQSYPKLLDWWQKENTKGRLIVPGNYTGKYSAEEIVNQVKRTRAMEAGGNVHFSMKSLMGEKFAKLKELYAVPAAVPAMPWLGERKK
ncbi:MAG: family 10 glycosylhydrolase [Gemmataceae bacterium]|nr:family 10 glycosylhydrolase [Gemmataceae bacterium]